MNLPDAERLCEQLVGELRPRIGPKSAMIGLYTGGAWLAERLHRLLEMKSPLGLMDIAFYRDDYAARGLKRSEEHTSELQSQSNLVCRLLLEKKKKKNY